MFLLLKSSTYIHIYQCTRIIISECQMNNSKMRLFSFWFFRTLYFYLCHIDIFIKDIWSPAMNMKSLAVKRVMCCENWKTKILRLSDVGKCAINKIESGIKNQRIWRKKRLLLLKANIVSANQILLKVGPDLANVCYCS